LFHGFGKGSIGRQNKDRAGIAGRRTAPCGGQGRRGKPSRRRGIYTVPHREGWSPNASQGGRSVSSILEPKTSQHVFSLGAIEAQISNHIPSNLVEDLLGQIEVSPRVGTRRSRIGLFEPLSEGILGSLCLRIVGRIRVFSGIPRILRRITLLCVGRIKVTARRLPVRKIFPSRHMPKTKPL
jgi:hypothetical protein